MQMFSNVRQMQKILAVSAAVTTAAAVLTLAPDLFGARGDSPLTAYAETPDAVSAQLPNPMTEETMLLTEEKLKFYLMDQETIREGQLVVGNTLMTSVQEKQETRERQQQAIAVNKSEIQRIQEERARIAAEQERIRKEEEARKAAAVVSYSDQDYEVLTRIVQAEAGICDTRGKILVANVVLNRVRDPEFPDTITDVVYQKSQFSPVMNGTINSCQVTAETIDAVNRALAGEDYSQGALYFMNRSRSHSGNVSWFDGRLTYLFQHERHEFFK